MVKPDQGWFFKFFETISGVFVKRYLEANFEKYDIDHNSNPINSLKFFFMFAFARGVFPPIMSL